MSVLIVNDSKNNHGIVLSYFFVLYHMNRAVVTFASMTYCVNK